MGIKWITLFGFLWQSLQQNMMTIYYPPRSYNFCMFPLCRLTSPLEDKMPSIAQFINGVLVYCISFPIFSPIQNVRSKFSWSANVTRWKSVLSLYTSVLRNAILIFVACGIVVQLGRTTPSQPWKSSLATHGRKGVAMYRHTLRYDS
jgi:hypothetical protein